MVLTYRTFIILYCLQKFNGERSIYGIYHLLTGKKSSQTISDSNLYQLNSLFGTLKSITRSQIEECTSELLKHSLIEELQPNTSKYNVTKSGHAYIEEVIQKDPLLEMLNGKKYSDQAPIFWKRFSLLVQVISNLIHENKQYIAIQQEYELLTWVKNFLKHTSYDRYELSQKLFEECNTCLEKVSDLEATIFVMRLSSANRIGYTFDQMSSLMKQDQTRLQLLNASTIHFFLDQIESSTTLFPLLSQLIDLGNEDLCLTLSTRKTYQYLMNGKTIEQIAEIRNLKINTIEDHVVEIAHHIEDFSIDSFVSKHHQQLIIKSFKLLGTKQLRPIKEHVGIEITYFAIRLVLARYGDNHET